MEKLPKYVHERPDGWYVRRYFPKDQGGRTKYVQIVRKVEPPTEERAAVLAKEIEAAYIKSQHPMPVGADILSIVKEFVTAKKNAVKPKTATYYAWMERYFQGPFGKLDASSVKPRTVQAFYETLQAEGVSAKMVRKVHTFLSMVFKQAVRWEIAPRNPTEGLILPRAKKFVMEIFNEEEARIFMKFCLVKYPILAFAFDSWCRPSEYLALRHSDIDFKNHTVKIERDVVFPAGMGRVWQDETKTDSSQRTIELSDQICAMLRKLPKRGKLLFPNRNGDPINTNNLSYRIMTRACTDAGVKQIPLYSLRHTGASIALANGASLKDVSERLGHASVEITLAIYIHILPRTRTETVKLFADAVYGDTEKDGAPLTETPS